MEFLFQTPAALYYTCIQGEWEIFCSKKQYLTNFNSLFLLVTKEGTRIKLLKLKLKLNYYFSPWHYGLRKMKTNFYNVI